MSATSVGKYVGGRERIGPRNKDVLGEAISSSLQNIGTSAGQGLGKILQNQSDDRIFQQLANKDTTPLQQIQLIGKLSPNKQKSYLDMLLLSTKTARQEATNRRFEEEQTFKKGREARLNEGHIDTIYTRRIKEIKDALKDARKIDQPPLKEALDNLTKERDVNLKRLRKGQQPVFEFLQLEDQAQQESPITNNPTQVAQQAQTQPTQQQKVKFNPNNPAHAQRRLKVLEEVKGDRQRANEILSSEFST